MFMSMITGYSAAAAAPICASSLLSAFAENRTSWGKKTTEDTVGEDPKPQQRSAGAEFSCYGP